MKTNLRFFAVLFIFFASALTFSKLKAQSFTFINNLPCTVVVGYEIGDATGSGPGSCNTCFGIPTSATIPPFASVTIFNCTSLPVHRACVWINSIGGATLPLPCHQDCSPGASCCYQTCTGGFISNMSACMPGAPYNVTYIPGISWTIQ